jgi:5-methylcytosine-specific restriction endonuclease McrA
MARVNEFSMGTKQAALVRQKNRCASCGTNIWTLGNTGRAKHEFSEGARAHHMRPIQCGGSDDVTNCVIICESCHYSAHFGGDYRARIIAHPRDFLFFNG